MTADPGSRLDPPPDAVDPIVDPVSGEVLAVAARSSRRSPAAGALVGAVVAAAAVVFSFQNTRRVVMRFLWTEFDAPLWAALIVVFLSGLVVGLTVAVAVPHAVRRRREERAVLRRARQRA